MTVVARFIKMQFATDIIDWGQNEDASVPCILCRAERAMQERRYGDGGERSVVGEKRSWLTAEVGIKIEPPLHVGEG